MYLGVLIVVPVSDSVVVSLVLYPSKGDKGQVVSIERTKELVALLRANRPDRTTPADHLLTFNASPKRL